jgi:hypothetical protein
MINSITRGDCIEVMATMPESSVDFILTDPPYLVNYRDRSGRRNPFSFAFPAPANAVPGRHRVTTLIFADNPHPDHHK